MGAGFEKECAYYKQNGIEDSTESKFQLQIYKIKQYHSLGTKKQKQQNREKFKVCKVKFSEDDWMSPFNGENSMKLDCII